MQKAEENDALFLTRSLKEIFLMIIFITADPEL